MKRKFLLLITIYLLSVAVQPSRSQADPCSLESVLESFHVAALSEELNSWLQIYEQSSCSPRVISGVRQLVHGTETINGREVDFENAMAFDGVDDHVYLPNSLALPFVEHSFTVEAFINISRFSGSGSESDLTILGETTLLNSSSQANTGLHLVIRDTKPYLGFFFNDLSGLQTLTTGRWYHIAWTYESINGTMQIYVDGMPDAVASEHAALSGVQQLSIGHWSTQQTRFFTGQIAEVRIWNYARTQEEIAATMNTPLRGDEPGLVAYYPLDDVEDGSAEDLVAGNDGIVHR